MASTALQTTPQFTVHRRSAHGISTTSVFSSSRLCSTRLRRSLTLLITGSETLRTTRSRSQPSHPSLSPSLSRSQLSFLPQPLSCPPPPPSTGTATCVPALSFAAAGCAAAAASSGLSRGELLFGGETEDQEPPTLVLDVPQERVEWLRAEWLDESTRTRGGGGAGGGVGPGGGGNSGGVSLDARRGTGRGPRLRPLSWLEASLDETNQCPGSDCITR
mmetsp:Transcript_19643/g.63291  ORF Transcript_19643/g.63291 Transcript_19643/m.63291 type:complete len:218 (+) Transcript_19643:44-697(+)